MSCTHFGGTCVGATLLLLEDQSDGLSVCPLDLQSLYEGVVRLCLTYAMSGGAALLAVSCLGLKG